jgi:hypothetical protein
MDDWGSPIKVRTGVKSGVDVDGVYCAHHVK